MIPGRPRRLPVQVLGQQEGQDDGRRVRVGLPAHRCTGGAVVRAARGFREPSADRRLGHGAPAGPGGQAVGNRWGYELSADGPGTTLVTETFDCTRSPEDLREAVREGEGWRDAMTASLAKLELLARASGQRNQ
jgi:hypothetical protein